MCQALLSFPSGYKKKSLLISVFNEFNEKNLVSQDYCVCTHNCFYFFHSKFYIKILGIFLNQVFNRLEKYQQIYHEIDCLHFCTNTNFRQASKHREEKYSISLVEQFNIT